MAELTNEDIRTLSAFFQPSAASLLAVEAIAQRLVNEALTEAAAEVETCWGIEPGGLGERLVGPTVKAALAHAAQIVRARTTH